MMNLLGYDCLHILKETLYNNIDQRYRKKIIIIFYVTLKNGESQISMKLRFSQSRIFWVEIIIQLNYLASIDELYKLQI